MGKNKKCIDVSEHNGIINWEEVKPHIDYVIIRAGYGKNTEDKKFKYNIEQCEKLKIPVGVYWFSYSCSVYDAQKEAAKCISLIEKYNISLPVFFDFEYDSVRYAKEHGVPMTKKLVLAIAKEFLYAGIDMDR